jgi:hypothetical protein
MSLVLSFLDTLILDILVHKQLSQRKELLKNLIIMIVKFLFQIK